MDSDDMNIFIERSLEGLQRSRDSSIEAHYEFMEQLVKTNMDVLILSMLLNEPMCGYDIIKKIVSWSGVLLNQGTVYSALSLLEDEGILEARHERGNMRIKIYHITSEGREHAKETIKQFEDALYYIDSLFGDLGEWNE
jgi:DNA-binding PadR family transcriptional regulator